ncbi:hypothetical protein HYDPIDRAFT_116145 [Hydnomerulius pinastri MD-312]|uniref:Uncharacterized protein n=1 Tax=Hydnomerulius pinastri MD-312 TaxID=994086 RepID=A0A0C9V6H7_9AGAM|nr:hypothetical protein HYDPIDRAFT_116145 [Hydnomerulius pinastri MD-312]
MEIEGEGAGWRNVSSWWRYIFIFTYLHNICMPISKCIMHRKDNTPSLANTR